MLRDKISFSMAQYIASLHFSYSMKVSSLLKLRVTQAMSASNITGFCLLASSGCKWLAARAGGHFSKAITDKRHFGFHPFRIK